MSKRAVVAVIVMLWLGAAGGAAAQSQMDFEALKREALAQAKAQAGAAAPVVDLKLEDAVQHALENNLDLAVERLNPLTYDHTFAALYSNYRPLLTSTFGNGNAVTLPTSQLTGVTDKLTTGTVSWIAGVTQNVMWGGGSFSLGFNNSRVDSSNLFATRNPSYTTRLSANYTQPLLRNFKIDTTRVSLETTRIAQDISEMQVQAVAVTTAASVRSAYYDLMAARRAIEVAQQSLALASKLVAENQQRVEIGTMAPIDVIQAQSEEATRKQTLVLAQQTAQTAELTLKRLIVSGTDDPLWTASINPVDRPVFSPTPVDIDAVVKNALDKRIDLLQAKRQLDSNDLSIKNMVNQTMPALDLSGGYSLAGLGGTQIERSSALGGAITSTIPGGYLGALSNITSLDAPSWNVQLTFSYPFGTSAADANLARARLQLQQTQAQVKKVALQVAADVTNAALTVRSNEESVRTSTVARELAQRKLEAEQSKFEVGLSTNFLVVQAQRDLFDAQITELKSILAYAKSLVDLDRLQVTGTSGLITTIAVSGSSGATTVSSSTSSTSSTSTTRTGG